MLTIYSKDHYLHDPQVEMYQGNIVAPFERPDRAEIILDRIIKTQLGNIVSPDAFAIETALAVHDPSFVNFLETLSEQWQAAGFDGHAIPSTWPTRQLSISQIPNGIIGRMGHYSSCADVAFTTTTWQAALASKDVALTALTHVHQGERGVFGLCRPPGHHATYDQYGGYCFLNNAAIAAQQARNIGFEKVVILDVDFHHGNGTQQIFYDRNDVLVISLHADPLEAYPYYYGHTSETGVGLGEGYNINYTFGKGTVFSEWNVGLTKALKRVRNFGCDLLIVSLGVDTFIDDPISFFKLRSEDFLEYGKRIGKVGLPTVFLMEGGYAIEQLGTNTVNVLQGFDNC